jgi:hypothetical protein
MAYYRDSFTIFRRKKKSGCFTAHDQNVGIHVGRAAFKYNFDITLGGLRTVHPSRPAN